MKIRNFKEKGKLTTLYSTCAVLPLWPLKFCYYKRLWLSINFKWVSLAYHIDQLQMKKRLPFLLALENPENDWEKFSFVNNSEGLRARAFVQVLG